MGDAPLEVLRSRFQLQDFRGLQREIIDHLLAGGDALAVMPTGSGKSLVFQVPALLGRPTLVLSPLIALMKDQVDALRARGIEATFVNSTLSGKERDQRTRAFVRGEEKLLYCTPERFRKPKFLEMIAEVDVGLLAIDEAHCVTEWGHDFRPDYGRVGRIRELLGNPPTVALTATATPDVQDAIVETAGIPDARRFHAGIERPNLFLAVRDVADEEEKWSRLVALERRLSGSGIVYGVLIKDLTRLEDYLSRQGLGGVVYHGGLAREERRRMQDEFMSGQAPRVLATNAFGMGVDKSDIRSILHQQVPGSVEAYYQEVGRAGRDGGPSYCELLYQQDDLAIQAEFVDWANPDEQMFRRVAQTLVEWGDDLAHYEREDLERAVSRKKGRDGRIDTCLQWLEVLGVTSGSFEGRNLKLERPLDPAEIPPTIGDDKKQRDLQRLWQMVEFVRTEDCRRAWLARYFGLSEPDGPCGACDRCADGEAWLEEHFPASAAGRSFQRSEGEGQPLRRGDFVTVRGAGPGRIIRVHEGRRPRVEVELSTTLETRKFPIGAVRRAPQKKG